VYVVVEVDSDAVVEQTGLQTEIELAGALAGYFLVADVVKLCSGSLPQIFADAKRCAGSIVANVIIAAEIPSGFEDEVVDKVEC
jgi:hypothetical protein